MSDDENPVRVLAKEARRLAQRASQEGKTLSVVEHLVRAAEALELAAAAEDRLQLGLGDTSATTPEGRAATLHDMETSANNTSVTEAQLRRRGDAVAEAKAKHPVSLAIVASKWRNSTDYATKRLRISQSSLSKYISGKLETPAEVADRVMADFGLSDGVWPHPPRRR